MLKAAYHTSQPSKDFMLSNKPLTYSSEPLHIVTEAQHHTRVSDLRLKVLRYFNPPNHKKKF
jgi:hypothetical protein